MFIIIFLKIVNPKNFIFETKLQNIHQLQTRNGPSEMFLEELEKFLKQKGITPFNHIPYVDGKELDLYRLYTAVISRGGYEQVKLFNLLNLLLFIGN